MTIKCDECGSDMIEDSSQPYQFNRIPMVLFRCECDRTLIYSPEELEVKQMRKEITALYKWADNVREFFGDEAMTDLYDIYGGEEE